MPKELIHSKDEDNYINVGWSRDTYVQIGTVNPNPELAEATGWFLTIDRAAINHLIRTLRKARDQAYGVDE